MFEIIVNEKFLEVIKKIPSKILSEIIDCTISVNKLSEGKDFENEFVEDVITNLLRRV